MFYSIDGNIVKCEGGFPQRKVNSLTFQVKGKWFPLSSYSRTDEDANIINGSEYIRFLSDEENAITLDYGDGTVISKNFINTGNEYRLDISLSPNPQNYDISQHEFIDGYTGIRNITMTFEKPLSLTYIRSLYVLFEGAFPLELIYFENLDYMYFAYAFNVVSIPNSFPEKLDSYTVDRVLKNKLDKLEDSFFNTNLTSINLTASFNLNDNLSSNFFKINQLKETLSNLTLSDCDISELPLSFFELVKLDYCVLSRNNFSRVDAGFNNFIELETLLLGNTGGNLIDSTMPFFSNLNKLTNLNLGFKNIDLSDIETKWAGLKSLKDLSYQFYNFIDNNVRFNTFINSFYTLCTNEAYIDTSIPAAQADEYTNKFRDISWGDSSLSFTGTKQAPAGYIQGVSNGTPANEGEKVYVLQNQYGHTITHA